MKEPYGAQKLSDPKRAVCGLMHLSRMKKENEWEKKQE